MQVQEQPINDIQIYLLGDAFVSIANKKVKLQSKQALLLLAYLIEHPISHSRIDLSLMLWPDRNEAEALRLLRTLLSRLQKKIPKLLLIDRYTVCVDTDFQDSSVWIDTVQIKQLVTGNHAGNHVKVWLQALDYFRGDFIQGLDGGFSDDVLAWLDQKREQYTKQHISILKKIVEGYFSKAKASLGLQYTQRWLELDNYDEEAHRYMLQLYSLNGDFMAAKNHFSDLTQLLESQLGVAPEELTIECFHKLSLADYKPVNRLSNNFQNLPYKADDFVGRENELEAIRTILENYSLITLHAWGGVGKTRLALAFAERYKDLFKDGVLYISLTNQRYDNALDYFREALQLESSTVSDIIEDLKHFFSQRHLLLVIDNAEEYVEDLAILNQFLEASPELKIVVTSRVALGLQTEHQYPVQGLSLPVSVEDLKASESYELLESRMNLRAVPEDLDNTLLFQLLELSEGMPLVLEMMATWLTVMPSDRLTSISDLYELEHPLQDVDDRHKTIERCFEYSWSLLSVEHQNLAAAAAIFHTDFSFTGLQAVTGALIKDIFSVTHSSFLAHSSDGGFKQHAMVKYFCLQKLKANSKHFETVQENYINYYSGRVKELQKSYDQNQTLVGHKVNIDNLWDVACLLVKQGKANRIAYFVQTLSLYNVFTNDIVRGRSQIEHLLELIEDGRKQGLYHTYSMNEAVSLQIVTMLSHGSLIYINSQIGDIKKAQKILDEHGEDFHGAISTLQTINPTIAMFHKCFLDYCAANILTLKMNFVESKQILDKILEFEHVEHPTLQSFLISVRILQSHNLLFLGEYHDALAILQTNIEKHGDFDLRVQSYSNMATSYLVLGQRDLAKHYISLAQADMESTGVREFTYDIPFTQALIMIIEERFEEARVLIEQTNDNFFAHPSKQTKYDFRYSIRYFFTLATLYDRQNKTELLRRLTNQASAKATEHDDVHVLLTASYFSARAESATQAEQSKERFEYVYEHPQTPHYIKELAELELHSLNSSFASNL